MITAEQIIDNIIYSQTDGEEFCCLKKEDCLKAMQEYAKQFILQRNDLHAAALSLIRGIESGEIKVYPESEKTFDYVGHLEQQVIKANKELFKRV